MLFLPSGDLHILLVLIQLCVGMCYAQYRKCYLPLGLCCGKTDVLMLLFNALHCCCVAVNLADGDSVLWRFSFSLYSSEQ